MTQSSVVAFSRIAITVDDRVEETQDRLPLASVEPLGELLLQATNEGEASHADVFAARRDDEERATCILRVGRTTHEARAFQVAVEQRVTYRREVLAGDVIVVRSRLLEVRDKAIRLHHEMVKGESNEVAAETEIVGVHIDRATRRSVPFPEALLARLRSAVSPLGGAAS